jgi:hypothetical protein
LKKVLITRWLHEREMRRKSSSGARLPRKTQLTFDELKAKLAALEETGQTARRELAALEGRAERLRALERDRETLLQNYAEMVPEALGALEPEECHRVYNMLRLRTVAFPDGTMEVSGALGEELLVCKNETIGLYDPKDAHARALRFRALLEEEAHEVELALV